MSMIPPNLSNVSRGGVRTYTEVSKLGHVVNFFKSHPTVTSMVGGGLAVGIASSLIPYNPLDFGTAPSATILGGGLVLAGAGLAGRGNVSGSSNLIRVGHGLTAAGAGYAIISNWNLPWDGSNDK